MHWTVCSRRDRSAWSPGRTLENKTIDVSPQVIDDVANRVARNHRSQYRLQIDVATNNDDIAQFSKSSLVLGAIYVVD
jgi:hypothetical protein